MTLVCVSPSAPSRGRFLLGFALAVAVLLALAEAVLRLSPPADLHPFLGDDSPQDGPFQPDEDFPSTAWRCPRPSRARSTTPAAERSFPRRPRRSTSRWRTS